MAGALAEIGLVLVPLAAGALGGLLGLVIRQLRQQPPRAPRGMTQQEMIDRARRDLDMDVTNYYNFAFCGQQGSGKSTLVNSLRSLDDIDIVPGQPHNILDSAPTGEIETTRETKCYGCPEGSVLEFLRFWEHSGCGTLNHPTANYYEENTLFAFDCVLLIIDGRLGEYERQILQAAREHNTDVAIVVNKTEQRVESKMRRRPRADALNADIRRAIIQETVREAKQTVEQELLRMQQNPVPIFVVSAWKWHEFDHTRNEQDQELAMEIIPLLQYLINTAYDRRLQ